LRDLEAEWNALLAAAARDIHIFQSFNWIWHWANQFLPADINHEGDCGLYIITGRRNGPLAVLHPFVCHCRAGLTTLSFAGETVSQYGDILIDPANGGPEMLDRVWAYATENANGDVVALRKVRADANIVSVLEQQQAVVTERQVAPYLDLATTPDYEFYGNATLGKLARIAAAFCAALRSAPPQKYTSCHRDNGPANSPHSPYR
jgi:CelD/BcsL family acetyltransferase involved in cellulose biosynthesis